MSRVLEHLRPHLAELDSAERIYVGYSGGVDSHVLLHAVVAVLGAERVIAIHVNHQLSTQASDWAEHCASVCQVLGVRLRARVVDVPRGEASPENAAREARYQVFEQLLGEGGTLLLAHHQNDQAETVLYRLLRSSGPRGLAGIPVSRTVGRGGLLRPLLNLSRSELEGYASEHRLCWVEDASNVDLMHDRNYLRHEVTPALSRRWPDFAARIAASASLCEQAEALNNELAEIDLGNLSLKRERLGWSVDLSGLAALSSPRQANVLRSWAGMHCQSPPGYHSVRAVLDTLLPARRDGAPLVVWSGGEWRRFNGKLFLIPGGLGVKGLTEFDWNPQLRLKLADGNTLSATLTDEQGLRLAPGEQLKVKFRSGGEHCRPTGRAGSRSLKKLFQEYQLEPWLRDRVPLIYKNKGGGKGFELVAVGDLWVCQGFAVVGGDCAYRLCWDLTF